MRSHYTNAYDDVHSALYARGEEKIIFRETREIDGRKIGNIIKTVYIIILCFGQHA